VKKISLIIIVLCICIILISYSDSLSKQKHHIRLSEASEIEAVRIIKKGQITYQTDNKWIEELVNEINNSKATNIQSINDFPVNIDEYIQISFTPATGLSTLFLYEKQSGFSKSWYVEQPYNSICIANENLIEMVSQIETGE